MTLPDWSSAYVNQVAPILDQWADYYSLPREVVYGLVSQESRFNPNAIGDAGRAHGLTQIWLPTAQGIGYTGDANGLQDPNVNVEFGLKYFRAMLDRFGSIDAALSAYNGGLHNGVITNPAYVAGVQARAAYFANQWNVQADDTSVADATGDDGATGATGASVAGVVALLIGAYGVLRYTGVI